MRVARIVAPGELRFEVVPPPEPAPDQVRFRVEGCGVESATLAAWSGCGSQRYPLAPGEPGCEAWGVVDAIGDAVHDVCVGDRIAAISERGYAEMDVVDAGALLRLPAALRGVPFPGRTLAGALSAIERSRLGAGQTVAVVGIGFLGAMLVRLATLAGARVIALSRRPFSLSLGREMGAISTVDLRDPERAVAEVKELTQGELCDIAIEATARQPALTLAGRLVTARGKLVIAGRHCDGKREVDLDSWGKLGLDVINADDARLRVQVAGMKAALAAVQAEQLDPRPLYTHLYGLNDLAEALDTAQQRPLGFIKALIQPQLAWGP
jgi:threonine dehydrogenase-like Zn-dependent dehydrogenase